MKLFLLLLIVNTLFATNQSFSYSKKELRKIYRDHQRTIYCDCKYNYKNKKNMIDKESCGYVPRNKYTKKGKINIRANRVEWEHAIPAQNFGRQFSCWYNGDERCVTSKGKHYKGRKCCTKVNKQYRIMQADICITSFQVLENLMLIEVTIDMILNYHHKVNMVSVSLMCYSNKEE